jgi:hypothetical protein
MRSALLAILALSFATPALAAPSEAQNDMEQMASKLNDPATQAALSGGLSAMLGAIMDMRVDGFAKALEPLNNGKRIKMKGNTIREIAERRDPHFQEKLSTGSRAAINSMGGLASAFAVMMPQLEAAMEKMGDAMDRAKDRLPETK